MILASGDPLTSKPPLTVYGTGILAALPAVIGIPEKLGFSFGLLALSTFILTTLDTATRLGRYIFEEFFQLRPGPARYVATLATLALPTAFALVPLKDALGQPIPAWKASWPVFGATNHLLAGLTFVVLAVWLRRTSRKTGYIWAPLAFMTAATLYALVLLIQQYGLSLIGVIAVVLLALAVLLIGQGHALRMRHDTRWRGQRPALGEVLSGGDALHPLHIEVVFLYPWAIHFREQPVFLLGGMVVFLGILFLGWFYVIRKGAVDWAKD